MRGYQVLGVDGGGATGRLRRRRRREAVLALRSGRESYFKGEEARHCKAVVKARRRRRTPRARAKEAPQRQNGSATNNEWASQKQNGSQSKVQSYSGRARPRSPSTARTAKSPPSRTRCDPCLQSRARRRRRPGRRALGSEMARDDSGDFAVVDGARVVGVNGDRDRVSYDRVVEALATAARPLLVLLASVPQEATPKRRRRSCACRRARSGCASPTRD